ncbi:MAG: aldehyde dehydrogenase family protein [Candidatus Tectomicrobia bacterium]|uniref:Aldehyde dehydrogenase family protein n=1 Tax=Tectimicrobiota bacterium TaxID=2528274 RepID=A0A932FZU2_UNCTE|nr:aldehyde dehydrogenase family protein [Candidatus Tectomicrobia bacterium]
MTTQETATPSHTRLLINGQPVPGQGEAYEHRNPYTDEPLALVTQASPGQMEEAIEAAGAAFQAYRKLPAYQRAELLLQVCRGIEARSAELARTIAREIAKPLKTARGEVARAISTFRQAAEEAGHLRGEVLPMDAVPVGQGWRGFSIRQPIGVVAAITPFNFPLNLAAHKIAPALAVGNTVVWKPAPQGPLTALLLGEILSEAGIPPGVVNILPAPPNVSELLVTHPQVAMVSFTGSVAVGQRIRQQAGGKRLILELGSNSGNLISAAANLEHAAAACAAGGFAYAGQVCISVQRIYVQQPAWDRFVALLLEKVRALKLGDPLDPTTDIGPLIDEPSARRSEAWIQEAIQGGARLLLGGKRQGKFLEPTVLTDVRPEMRVVCEEVFAPLVVLVPFEEWRQAIALTNQSRFGINAGVFTRDIQEAFQAIEELEVGSVIINGSSTFRADHMPYGGIKESGLGREGIRYTMEAMTEIKFAAFAPEP